MGLTRIPWTKNRGRNGWDPALEVKLDQSVESENITLYNGGLGGKRGGSIAMTIVDYVGHNVLFEYVPTSGDIAAQLFVVSADPSPKILLTPAGSDTFPTWLNLVLTHAIASSPQDACAVAFNGKIYWAYNSGINRLHRYDGTAPAIYPAGLAPFAAAATVVDTGAGAYAATLRYYKTRSTQQSVLGATMRRSEGNTSIAFTPSGAGAAARITRPTAVAEGETHWEVYGSTDDITFYGPIATIAIATTTYDDSSTPSDWADDFDAEPIAGFHTPFPSLKFLGTDGSRLYGLGVYESTAGDSVAPKGGRLYFSPALDSSDTDDDERISNTVNDIGVLDLIRGAGVYDRGITKKPVNNVIYAFQTRGIHGIALTEDPAVPYRRIGGSSVFGAVNNQSIVIGLDRLDRDCAYFLDPILGPSVIGGADGLKWCGKDVKNIWDTINLEATGVVAWGLWYPDRNQVIFGIATGDSNDPDTILVLDTTEQYLDEDGDLRGGWTTWGGTFATARCGAVFSNTFASPRSAVKVPYVGLRSGTTLLRYDEDTDDDDGTAFQAYVTSGALAVEIDEMAVQRAHVIADAADGIVIQQSLIRNFGDEPARRATVTLDPVAGETIVKREFDNTNLQDAWAVQVTLGDETAIANQWQLHQYHAEIQS